MWYNWLLWNVLMEDQTQDLFPSAICPTSEKTSSNTNGLGCHCQLVPDKQWDKWKAQSNKTHCMKIDLTAFFEMYTCINIAAGL